MKEEDIFEVDRLEELDDEGMQYLADYFIQHNIDYDLDSLNLDPIGYSDVMKVHGFDGLGGIELGVDMWSHLVKLGKDYKAINRFGEIVVSKLGKDWDYFYNGENLTIWNTQHLVLSEDKESLIELDGGSKWPL